MNILLVGSGGREHALAWTLSASPLITQLYCAPGNAGIAAVADCVPIEATDLDGLVAFAKERQIDFVVIGPEAPLAAGLWDRLEADGVKALGPSAAGAQLEASKGFVKDLCAERGIPTAAYRRCRTADDAKAFARSLDLPVVVKADGLAQGKGVVIAESRATADEAIDAMFSGAFGAAGNEVVVEEFLDGEEASFFVLSDGTHVLPLTSAQDHKRAFDGDKGPNTGGMGTYSPAPVFTFDLVEQVRTRLVEPAFKGIAQDGSPYRGVLFVELMATRHGPKLVEFNARFGDPECQVLMLRLESDLVPYLLACATGRLSDMPPPVWRDADAVCVVLATQGYPGAARPGSIIRGAEQDFGAGVVVFHAGTSRGSDGELVAGSGRALNVCALGEDLAEARERAYGAIALIDWPEGFHRTDIGWRALAR